MVTVPAARPVTVPEVEPMLAIDGLLLVQLPPAVDDNVVPDATHTLEAPVIAAGVRLTVTIIVAIQPVGSV